MSDQFELLEKLGSGGMGDVYRARDKRLNRIVAVKLLSADSHGDEKRRQRFFQEAQAASALNHPNIITIHDVVSEPSGDLIVMECVVGKTLAELIPKGGLRVPTIINYGLQIADALGAAHNAGIVHRDLKPGNVMVTERGICKVLDFGLAKLMDQPIEGDDPDATRAGGPLTFEGAIIGTVAYMSPEQAQGLKVDARSDIFSFGALLYEMATGHRAFENSSTLSTLTAVLRDETRPILELSPDVPAPLEQLIQRCLRKNPDDRWQSMQEVHTALHALKEVSDSGTLYRTIAAPPLPPPPPMLPPPVIRQAPMRPFPAAPPRSVPPPVAKKKVWPIVAVALGILLLAAGALSVWWILSPRQKPTVAVVVPPPATVQAPPPQPVIADRILRNNDILEMVKAKVPQSLIISQIQSSQTEFNLTSAELIRLVQGGVSEAVIEVMRNPTKIPQTSTVQLPANAKQLPPPPTPAVSTGSGKSPAPGSPPPAPAPPGPAPSGAAAPDSGAPGPVTKAPEVTVVTVADGTPMLLRLLDDVSVDAAEGTLLHFAVAADLKVKGVVVIKEGAPASAVVVDEAKKRKFFGGTTKITYRMQTVESVDGKQLRIRSTPVSTSGDAAKRPLESKKTKPPGVAVPKGTDCLAYLDGEVVVNVSP